MYSWRARIGLIAPIDEAVEYAFNKYAPPGVAINTTKLWFPGPTPEGLVYLSDQLEEAARMYRDKKHDVIMFGCTSGSCIKGFGFDEECIQRIERASGSPGLTTSTAILEALSALKVKNIAVMTPYPEETNEAEKKFLEDNGFRITNIIGVGFNKDGDYSFADELFLYRKAKEMDKNGADCFFLSCMGLTTMELVEIFETDFGIPCITSHQASFWSCLRHAGIKDKISGLGKLLKI